MGQSERRAGERGLARGLRGLSRTSSLSSLYFWFERALIGDVYSTRWVSRSEVAMAYSAQTVLPADVCAETSTDSSRSMQATAAFWNGSSSNLYVRAGTRPSGTSRAIIEGSGDWPGGIATSCLHALPVDSSCCCCCSGCALASPACVAAGGGGCCAGAAGAASGRCFFAGDASGCCVGGARACFAVACFAGACSPSSSSNASKAS